MKNETVGPEVDIDHQIPTVEPADAQTRPDWERVDLLDHRHGMKLPISYLLKDDSHQ